MEIVRYISPQEAYKEECIYEPFGTRSQNKFVNLSEYWKIIASQSGEDGIIEHVFSKIAPRQKFCVEFGASDGRWLSNTWDLRVNKGWGCLAMDSDSDAVGRSSGVVKLESIDSNNINHLFEKYSVPVDFDFLSIDIDGDDIYVFDKLDEKYRPILICGEYNPGLPNHLPLAIEEGMTDKWGSKRRNPSDPYDYHGCNIHAWYQVGLRKNYKVLTTSGVNVFLIADEYSTNFSIPSLQDICVPPYFKLEYNRFQAGASNRENYLWCQIK